jgi:putative transposase
LQPLHDVAAVDLPLVPNATTIMKGVRSVIQRQRFPLDLAYPLNLRNLEEMMEERGVFVDHSTIHRWVTKLVPVLEEVFRQRKRKRGIGAVGKSWRLDEAYIKIGGKDRYWYRAVDKQGNTVDFLLTDRDTRSSRGTAVFHARRQEQPCSQDRQHR